MNKEKVSQIISDIDSKYIDEAAVFAAGTGLRSRKRRWGLLAACLAVLIVAGFGIFAYASDAKEYNKAIAFFEENGLSAEGLSRSEIKEVYRDITTKSFSYGKTAEVIKRAVPGWEISQDEPTPEEVAAIWDRIVWRDGLSGRGYSYRNRSVERFDLQRQFNVFDKSILECYLDGELLWTAEFTDFYVNGYAHTAEGTAVWGWTPTTSSDEIHYAWIARVDESGNVLWQRRLEHSQRWEDIGSVLSGGDGTLVVISRDITGPDEEHHLFFSRFDMDGRELTVTRSVIGLYGIWDAARLGDGFIVQLGYEPTNETALLCRLDHDGNIIDNFSYEADDCEYRITDMIEFGGQVFLSAYAYPTQEDEGGRDEIANILQYAFSRAGNDQGWEIPSEELTPLVRDNYTAVLLMCDPEEGTPRTFYSVKGSLGGKLLVNGAGELEWDVESITSTYYSPMTSSFTIGGTCKVFCYTFDANGVLTGHVDTGESVPYSR